MNAYDFDKTIYDGDSTIDFYLFCLLKHPLLLSYLPRQMWHFLLYKLGCIDKTNFKECFFGFLLRIPDANKEVSLFWDKNEKKIKEWYKEQAEKDDLIISASPYFLLNEICRRLKINNLIASDVDIMTGKFRGKNCYGNEKLLRFREEFSERKVKKFYSDSHSDLPMANEAEEAFIVKNKKIIPWY